MCTEALLRKLEGSLILSDTQELQHALLVRGESAHFLDDFADDDVSGGDLALCVGGALLQGLTLGDDVPLVDTDCDSCHCDWDLWTDGSTKKEDCGVGRSREFWSTALRILDACGRQRRRGGYAPGVDGGACPAVIGPKRSQ